MHPKLNLKAGPPKRIYAYEDMQVVWRADGSVLYKSDRTRGHYIGGLYHKCGPNEIDQAAIYLMLHSTHNKDYNVYQGVVNTTDNYNVAFYWQFKTKSYILSHIGK